MKTTKVLLFLFFFYSLYCSGQKNSDLTTIGQIQSYAGGKSYITPIFNLKKIKLTSGLVKELVLNCKAFHNANRESRHAVLDFSRVNDQDSVALVAAKQEIEKTKQRFTDAESALRKSLRKVFPKTEYSGYTIDSFGSSISIEFFDNTFNMINWDDDALSIMYTQDFKTNRNAHTVVEYYENGNVKKISSSINDNFDSLIGFYGLYNKNGSVVREFNLDTLGQERSVVEMHWKSFMAKESSSFTSPEKMHCESKLNTGYAIHKLFDTNYGNIWVINYVKILLEKDTGHPVTNSYLILRDDNMEVIASGTINKCYYGMIPLEGANYKFINSDAYEIFNNKNYKEVEKELNKKIILTKTTPFDSN